MIFLVATLLILLPSALEPVSACSVSSMSQTHDSSGTHTATLSGSTVFGGPGGTSAGSCSVSNSQANHPINQGHVSAAIAGNNPGFSTGTCSSTSASYTGSSAGVTDGQGIGHSGGGDATIGPGGSCSASSHSP